MEQVECRPIVEYESRQMLGDIFDGGEMIRYQEEFYVVVEPGITDVFAVSLENGHFLFEDDDDFCDVITTGSYSTGVPK